MTEKKTKNWKKFKEETEEALMHDEQETESNTSDEEANQTLGHPSYEEIEEKLTLAEQKAHENWEKAVRASAELENIRRLSEREIEKAHRYGLEKLITAMLPVLDSLEQALQLAEQQADKGLHEGLVLTMKLFQDTLEKFGARLIDPLGQVFDPQQHEAMATQPSTDAEPNTVITVFQKGCLLNDRVIRPARVIVAKN